MKLITEKGEVALPENFSFTIEKESPFHGDSGTASIPVTLPVSQQTFNKLERPERLGRSTTYIRKLKAKLEAGIIHKDGVLVIDTASRAGGVTASLALDESDLYTSYKEKKLTEIFEGVERTDYNSIVSWVEHLAKCAAGQIDDWFTIATVAVDKEESDGSVTYQFLNDVDVTSSETVWPLIYKTRSIYEGDKEIRVPGGYGIAPFFYLGKFLEQLMLQMGYTLRNNKFKTDSVLKKIILLHNAADAICPGTITISDIVPTCTLSDFLEFLNNRFHAQIFVYPEQKIADVVFFEDLLTSDADVDISAMLDGHISITYPDPKQINLESNTDLDDSEPAEDTIHSFVKKYPVCNSVSEVSFMEDFTGVCLRRALGRYYRGTYDAATEKYSYEHLGTNNFNYRLKTLEEEDFSASDASYGMISYLKNSEYRNRPIVAPYIGEKRHPCTTYIGEDSSSDDEQEIILAFAPGAASSNTSIVAGYYLATNQKYDNLGDQWNTWGLNYAEMYPLFWQGYNGLLQNAAPTMNGKFRYSGEQLMSLRLDVKKFFRGMELLMNNISYSIGKAMECAESEYIVLQNLSSPVVDPEPVISEQQYKWQRKTNIDELLAMYPSPQYAIVAVEYDQEQTDYSDSLPAPTELGQTGYNSEEAVTITVDKTTSVGDTVREVHDEVLKIWYESVPV